MCVRTMGVSMGVSMGVNIRPYIEVRGQLSGVGAFFIMGSGD